MRSTALARRLTPVLFVLIVCGVVTGLMRLKGHALIWHNAVPGWVERLSADDLRAAFARHIRSVAAHYRGQVFAWDVVNEAVADDGSGLRDTVFRQKLGDGYIADAFRLAHEADPQALLFYNDYGAAYLSMSWSLPSLN